MRLNKLKSSLLVLVVLIAAALRFYQLADIPPALSWDEVAWGYNSYSLGIDGKDEFGVFLPYKFIESFGDFKPPLYAYIGIIPIKIWGLTEFAVRFPSAFFGVLTVLLTYFLTKEIFYNSKNREYYSIFTSFLLAISPWHINLSRAAFEANVAQFFIVGGVLAFLFAVRKNPWFLVVSALFLSLTFYTFNTARIVVPIVVIVLGIVFVKKLWRHKKQTVVAGLVGAALVIPLVGFLLSPQAALRYQEVNIFSNPNLIEKTNQEIENSGNNLYASIINNRRIKYSIEYLNHYFHHFQPKFLFISGDSNPKFSTQDVGQLYLWSLPFLIIGSILLFRKKEGRWWIVPFWLFAAIIPAATARETPHALRTETTLPMFQILAAYGFVNSMLYFKEKVHKSWLFKAIVYGSLLILLLNVGYYLYGYYVHYSREYSAEWEYGYEEVFSYVLAHEDEYDKIYITRKLGRPYIYYLYYSRMHPEDFRKNADIEREEKFGFVHVTRIGKYYFTDSFDYEKIEGRALFVDDPNRVPDGAEILDKIKILRGDTTLVVFTI